MLQKASGSPDTAVSLDVLGDSCPGGEIQFLDGLLDDTVPGTEWTMAFNSQFGSSCSETVGFPLEIWSPIQELDLPSYEHQLILPTNTHFEALSRLNVDIRKGLENVTRFVVQPTFEDFICTPHKDMGGYRNVQLLMTNGQEFLDIIMALHRQLGTRPVPRQTHPPSPNPFTLALDSFFTTPAKPSSTGTTPDDDLPECTTHDAPTMLLVISCYVQLIKHIEILLDIVYESINNPEASPIGRAPMSYAGVPIIQPSSQFILFCELVYHVVAQINLVLGLPSAWSGRSVWTGLLRPQRYRNLVNAELGAVDGSWTTRPAKVLEKTKMTKDMFVELGMMGLDA